MGVGWGVAAMVCAQTLYTAYILGLIQAGCDWPAPDGFQWRI